MRPFLLHIVLAVVWMLMFASLDPYTLLGGLLIAAALIAMRGPVDPTPSFRGNPLRLLRFVRYFVKILIVANWQVARLVLSPAMPIHPRIIRYDVAGLTAAQVTTLANSITLTPGTLAVDLAPDGRTLYIHCLNAEDRAAAVRELDELKARLEAEVFA